jgi:hypothetical protein
MQVDNQDALASVSLVKESMSSEPKNRPFEERVNQAIHEAAGRLDRESEKLITYLNDEVVPAVREHSSRGLRVAAEKLAKFADFMDQQSGSAPPPPDENKR